MLLQLDKILFICSCTYLLAVLGWLASQNKLPLHLATSSIVQEGNPTNSDTQFIAYLQNSLTRIDRKQRLEEKEIPVEAPENIAQQPKDSIKELERVYIPLYQPPKIISQSPPAPPEVLPPPPPVLPPPPISTAPALTPEVNSNPSSVPIINANFTLVGLLKSEKGAIALFKMNGVTDRVEIGQKIGTSGWTLVDIVNEQALLGYNEQFKTISVGESF